MRYADLTIRWVGAPQPLASEVGVPLARQAFGNAVTVAGTHDASRTVIFWQDMPEVTVVNVVV
jgi:hypothetical protein